MTILNNNRLTNIGFRISLVILAVVMFMIGFRYGSFRVGNDGRFIGLSLNEWGDFFAGFGTLAALVWLVIGHRQQQHDLAVQMNQLEMQRDELRSQKEVQAETTRSVNYGNNMVRYKQIKELLVDCPIIRIKGDGFVNGGLDPSLTSDAKTISNIIFYDQSGHIMENMPDSLSRSHSISIDMDQYKIMAW